MKKVLMLSAVLALFAAPSFAAGLDLGWGSCPANGGGPDQVFNCADPYASYTLYGEFVSDQTINNFTNMDPSMDLQVDDPGLPEFWNFKQGVTNPNGCNGGWTFGDERPGGGVCTSSLALWGGVIDCGSPGCISNAAMGFSPGLGGANRGRFAGFIARPSTSPTTLVAGTKYFGFRLNFQTYFAGLCAGCTIPGRLVWNSATLGSLGAVNGVEADVVISGPGDGTDDISFNGGGNVPGGATPTQSKTWGALKSLYR